MKKTIFSSIRQGIVAVLASSFLVSCYSGTLCPDREPDPLPELCMPERIRVALVLGSGGVRGMAHVGVIEELVNAGIPIDLIVGCSAGSIVGALYADNPCIEDLKRSVSGMRSASLLDFDICNCRWGLCKGKSMRQVIDDNLVAETFDELKIPLVVVATDLCTGELIPMGSGDLVKSVDASCSIPLLYVPCYHTGRALVDGGVINPVPVKVARDLGAEIIIAVDLCELLPKTLPKDCIDVFLRSAEIAFMWQNQLCTVDADFVIRPKTCDVGTFNDKMKWQIYEAGKNAAIEELPEIKNAIAAISMERDCTKTRMVLLNPYTPRIYMDDLFCPVDGGGDKSLEDRITGGNFGPLVENESAQTDSEIAENESIHFDK